MTKSKKSIVIDADGTKRHDEKLESLCKTENPILTSIYKTRMARLDKHLKDVIEMYENGLITGAECAERMLQPVR